MKTLIYYYLCNNVFSQAVNEVSVGDLLIRVLKIERVINVLSEFPGKGRENLYC